MLNQHANKRARGGKTETRRINKLRVPPSLFMGPFPTEDPADAPSWLENDFFECNQTYWGHFLVEENLI